jgi:GTP cyclohydrolase I
LDAVIRMAESMVQGAPVSHENTCNKNKETHGQEPVWMRSIPTSILCNFWLFFAALCVLYTLVVVIPLIAYIPSSPVLVLSTIAMVVVLMSVSTFQNIGLYLICKRGVHQEQGFRAAPEGFAPNRRH